MMNLLTNIFGDAINDERRLVVFSTPDKRSRFFTDVESAAQYARSISDARNVYFGLSLMSGRPSGRGKRTNAAAIGALWADIDIAGSAHDNKRLPGSIDDARDLLGALPLRASVVVDSGHGLHAYWLLKEPWLFDTSRDRDEAAKLTRAWHGLVCTTAEARGWALENLGDLTRVLRLPETLNHNGGGDPAPVRFIEYAPDLRYDPSDFEAYVAESPDTSIAVCGDLVLRPEAEPPAIKLAEALLECPQFRLAWERDRPDLPDQSQSGYDLSLATVAALRDWMDQEIADLIIAARRRHKQNPGKALRLDYVNRTIARARACVPGDDSTACDVDLGRLLDISLGDADPAERQPPDPGPIPEELLRVPGFISEVMDHCLETAPYPNPTLAFGGALALQAFLAGRRVRDPGDNRTNIYILGLAHSSAGKDAPRKINTRIVHAVGLERCLGERLASGEGVQDALFSDPTMLVQTDEIDGMLQSINKAQDARHENMMSTLLTMYSSANSVYPMRRKAGKEHPGVIDQPCLVLFGTAIPNHYFQALSERMLTNGLFARMLILEASHERIGQEASIRALPSRIEATARWWADFNPGGGNLTGCLANPAIVEHTDGARRVLSETRDLADAEYNLAQTERDAVGTTVWGRVSEQARKLALIYAVSENHEQPRIGTEAASWASQLVTHQVRRMLHQVAGYAAENPFHADCLKLIRKLQEAPDHQMKHNDLLRAMRCKLVDFEQLTGTLLMQGTIIPVEIKTKTKPARGYRLAW